jgi:hypothetical protein
MTMGLQELWDACEHKDELGFVADCAGLWRMKPYETKKIAYLRETLAGVNLDEFAEYPDGVALVRFLKKQLKPGPTLDTSEERGTLEFRYLAQDAHPAALLLRIEKAVVRAREILESVIKLLDGLGTREPGVLLRQIFGHHFKFQAFDGPEWTAGLPRLRQNYRAIHTGLSTRVRIADARGRYKKEDGYVSRRRVKDVKSFDPGLVSKHHTIHETAKGVVVMGTIHLTFEKFLKEQTRLNQTPRKKTALAGLVIHEASHKFCATRDHAYVHQRNEYKTMTHAQALENADSYAFVALSLHCWKLVEDNSLFELGEES